VPFSLIDITCLFFIIEMMQSEVKHSDEHVRLFRMGFIYNYIKIKTTAVIWNNIYQCDVLLSDKAYILLY
jgi:hypothetical protein